ncbi:Son of sevenless 2 [Cichlidogyrus casuarinus]|uniref:Son of sevenless 2 n=1 Tax=Cichlidogyrus casuarinus TaxID=1844966 RepID=A0ABD2Q001_9PLAT
MTTTEHIQLSNSHMKSKLMQFCHSLDKLGDVFENSCDRILASKLHSMAKKEKISLHRSSSDHQNINNCENGFCSQDTLTPTVQTMDSSRPKISNCKKFEPKALELLSKYTMELFTSFVANGVPVNNQDVDNKLLDGAISIPVKLLPSMPLLDHYKAVSLKSRKKASLFNCDKILPTFKILNSKFSSSVLVYISLIVEHIVGNIVQAALFYEEKSHANHEIQASTLENLFTIYRNKVFDSNCHDQIRQGSAHVSHHDSYQMYVDDLIQFLRSSIDQMSMILHLFNEPVQLSASKFERLHKLLQILEELLSHLRVLLNNLEEQDVPADAASVQRLAGSQLLELAETTALNLYEYFAKVFFAPDQGEAHCKTVSSELVERPSTVSSPVLSEYMMELTESEMQHRKFSCHIPSSDDPASSVSRVCFPSHPLTSHPQRSGGLSLRMSLSALSSSSSPTNSSQLYKLNKNTSLLMNPVQPSSEMLTCLCLLSRTVLHSALLHEVPPAAPSDAPVQVSWSSASLDQDTWTDASPNCPPSTNALADAPVKCGGVGGGKPICAAMNNVFSLEKSSLAPFPTWTLLEGTTPLAFFNHFVHSVTCVDCTCFDAIQEQISFLKRDEVERGDIFSLIAQQKKHDLNGSCNFMVNAFKFLLPKLLLLPIFHFFCLYDLVLNLQKHSPDETDRVHLKEVISTLLASKRQLKGEIVQHTWVSHQLSRLFSAKHLCSFEQSARSEFPLPSSAFIAAARETGLCCPDETSLRHSVCSGPGTACMCDGKTASIAGMTVHATCSSSALNVITSGLVSSSPSSSLPAFAPILSCPVACFNNKIHEIERLLQLSGCKEKLANSPEEFASIGDFVLEGKANVRECTKRPWSERMCYLFTGLLLICKQQPVKRGVSTPSLQNSSFSPFTSSGLKIKQRIPLYNTGMHVIDSPGVDHADQPRIGHKSPVGAGGSCEPCPGTTPKHRHSHSAAASIPVTSSSNMQSSLASRIPRCDVEAADPSNLVHLASNNLSHSTEAIELVPHIPTNTGVNQFGSLATMFQTGGGVGTGSSNKNGSVPMGSTERHQFRLDLFHYSGGGNSFSIAGSNPSASSSSGISTASSISLFGSQSQTVPILSPLSRAGANDSFFSASPENSHGFMSQFRPQQAGSSSGASSNFSASPSAFLPTTDNIFQFPSQQQQPPAPQPQQPVDSCQVSLPSNLQMNSLCFDVASAEEKDDWMFSLCSLQCNQLLASYSKAIARLDTPVVVAHNGGDNELICENMSRPVEESPVASVAGFRFQRWLNYPMGRVPGVVVGTIAKLVDRVTHPLFKDHYSLGVLLLAFRRYVTPRELLDLFIERYKKPHIDWDLLTRTSGADSNLLHRLKKNHSAHFTSKVQSRVLKALLTWVGNTRYYLTDFAPDIGTRNHLLKFLQEDIHCRKHLLLAIDIFLQTLRSPQNQQPSQESLTNSPAKSTVPEMFAYDSLRLFNVHPLELGQQITLHEWNLYSRIEYWELETTANKSLNLNKSKDFSNRFRNWLVLSILREKSHDARVIALQRVIDLQLIFAKLNNDQGLQEAKSALISASVNRLKKAYVAVKRLRHYKEAVDELRKMEHHQPYASVPAQSHSVPVDSSSLTIVSAAPNCESEVGRGSCGGCGRLFCDQVSGEFTSLGPGDQSKLFRQLSCERFSRVLEHLSSASSSLLSVNCGERLVTSALEERFGGTGSRACVPFIAKGFHTKLIHIDLKYPDTLSNCNLSLVNFAKHRARAEIIEHYLAHQSPGYDIQPIGHIQAFLKELDPFKVVGCSSQEEFERLMYQLSEMYEPRDQHHFSAGIVSSASVNAPQMEVPLKAKFGADIEASADSLLLASSGSQVERSLTREELQAAQMLTNASLKDKMLPQSVASFKSQLKQSLVIVEGVSGEEAESVEQTVDSGVTHHSRSNSMTTGLSSRCSSECRDSRHHLLTAASGTVRRDSLTPGNNYRVDALWHYYLRQHQQAASPSGNIINNNNDVDTELGSADRPPPIPPRLSCKATQDAPPLPPRKMF